MGLPPRVLVALLALGVSAPALAQRTVDVRLPAPEALPGASFSVERALDLRADTALGTARTGITNRRRPLALVGGAVPAVGAFLRALAPPAPGAAPLVVGVETLALSERATTAAEFARAEVALRFFVARGDSLAEVGRTAAFAERSGLDVTGSHDDTAAEALRTAVALFAGTDWAGVPLEFVPVDRVPAPRTAPAGASLPPRLAVPSPLGPERALRRFVAAGPVVGRNGSGGRFQFGVRPADPGPWSVPASFEVQALSVTNEAEGLEGLFLTYGPALQVARRLGRSPAALQVGFTLSGGNEQIGDEARFFFGGRVGAELALVGRSALVSAGVYGARLFGSRLYPDDLGVTATLGVPF